MAVSHVKSDTIADFTGTITGFNSQGSTTTIAATDLVRPVDWNSAHNEKYTVSGNTSLSSTASGSNVVFSATGNITIIGSSDTIVWSVPPRDILSAFLFPDVLNNTATMSFGGGSSIYVFPFILPQDGSFSFIRLPASWSIITTTMTTAAGGYNSNWVNQQSFYFNIYSQGTGANSRSLQYLTGGSTTWAFQYSVSGTSSTHTVSMNITFPGTFGVSSSTQLTTQGTSQTVNEVPAGTSNFTAFRAFDIPFATSLSAGNYWAAWQLSTGGNSSCGLRASGLVVTQHNSHLGELNVATNSSQQLYPWLGSWSTNSAGTTTSSIGMASISTLASHPLPAFQLLRFA
jgi:hypothetical protein